MQDIDAKNQDGECLYVQAIADTMQEAFVVLDDQLRVVFANPVFYRMYKISDPEAEGTCLFELGGGQWAIPKIRQALESVAEGGPDLTDFRVEQEIPDTGRRDLVLKSRRVHKKSGRKNLIFLTIADINPKTAPNDITEERHQRILTSEAYSLIDSSPVGIARVDEQKRYTYVNPAFAGLAGKPIDQLLGKIIGSAGLPEQSATVLKGAIGETKQTRREQTIEVPFENKVYLTTVMPVINDAGQVRSFMLFSRDVTRRKVAEKQIRDNENRFRTMLENSQDIAYLRDLQNDSYEYISPVIEQITGFSADELDMQTVISQIHPDDRDRVRRVFETTRNHEIESGFLEYRFRTKDGRYLWLGDKYKLMQDEKSRPRYRTGIVRDMTDRRRMEEDLRVSRDAADAATRKAEEQRRIIETILVGIPEGIIVAKAPDGRLQFVSTYCEKYFEIPAGKLLAMPMAEQMKILQAGGWHGEAAVPEEMYPIFRALHRGEMIMDEEWRIIKPDGSRAVLSTNAAPVRDANGAITHAVVSFRDITESKELEVALRRNEYELRTLVESTPDLILRIDKWLCYSFVNAAFEQLTGKTKEQCIGRTHKELGMPEELCRYLENGINRVLRTGREHSIEFGFLSLFGKRHFWARLIPEFDRIGKVETVLVVARDITERKRAEDHIRFVSFHDTVTGLYNRTYFEEEVQRLNTERSLPVSFIMGDVNNLKLVNDTFGHNEGDNFLRKIAEAIREACRDEDIVARWGGDEFAVILPETDVGTAKRVCERIRTITKQAKGTVIAPSIALGVAAKQQIEENVYRVIREAEEKMYENKLAENRQNQDRVISSLMVRLKGKFPDLENHIARERKLAQRFGRAIGLSDSQMDAMDQIIRFHEIGKAIFPESVFNKPGPLTRKEWETVKRHPEAAYRIIKTFPETAKISDEILAVREHWDGTGYPRGLKGNEIPFLARVFSIMDAYDAITHQRPYDRTLTDKEALKELRRNAGRQFDPELSDTFIQMMAG